MDKQPNPKKWKLINSWDALPGDQYFYQGWNPVTAGMNLAGLMVRREMTPVEQNAPKVMAMMKKLLQYTEAWDNSDPEFILVERAAGKLVKELSRSR